MHDTVVFYVPLTTAKTHSCDNILWSRTAWCLLRLRRCATHYLYSRSGILQVLHFTVPHFQRPHADVFEAGRVSLIALRHSRSPNISELWLLLVGVHYVSAQWPSCTHTVMHVCEWYVTG